MSGQTWFLKQQSMLPEKKTVSVKTTGHKKSRVSVCLAAKADGTKPPPFIVFKRAKRETAALDKEIKNCYIASSPNAWMNTELTHVWVNKVLGTFSFRRRYLAWDSYEYNIQDSVKSSLHAKKIEVSVVPGGCTKYIQAPDFSWNKPFKTYATEMYDQWLAFFFFFFFYSLFYVDTDFLFINLQIVL